MNQQPYLLKFSLTFTLYLLLINFSGCTKEDTIVIERKQWLLINKKWQITGLSVKTTNGNTTNEYDSLPSFSKDDYFLFRADSTYQFNDNLDTMPGKNSKILDAGTWQLNNKQTHLEMHSDVFNTSYTTARILELGSTKLSIERTDTGNGSVTVTTFKAL